MYVQLYVYPVAQSNIAPFLRIQREASELYKRYGAVDDETFEPRNLEPKYGCAGFPDTIRLKQGETVFFSVTRFRDRSHQDEVMSKVNADKRINELYDEISSVIDVKRVVRGEFERA
jgi:uncharacterized protein YbaA (DUF1428 family)